MLVRRKRLPLLHSSVFGELSSPPPSSAPFDVDQFLCHATGTTTRAFDRTAYAERKAVIHDTFTRSRMAGLKIQAIYNPTCHNHHPLFPYVLRKGKETNFARSCCGKTLHSTNAYGRGIKQTVKPGRHAPVMMISTCTCRPQACLSLCRSSTSP